MSRNARRDNVFNSGEWKQVSPKNAALGGDPGIGQSQAPKLTNKKFPGKRQGAEPISQNLLYFCASDPHIPVSYEYQALVSPPLSGSQECQVQSRQSLTSIYQEVWSRGWPAPGSNRSCQDQGNHYPNTKPLALQWHHLNKTPLLKGAQSNLLILLCSC